MGFIEIETDGLNEVIKNVGGFWSAISGVSFVAFNFFLYRFFFTSTVDMLLKEEMEKMREGRRMSVASQQE